MNVRAAAAIALAPVLKGAHSLQSSFDQGIDRVNPKDKALYHELVMGALRKFETLDHIASALLTKKLKSKDTDIYALILLGIYQLAFMRTPDHAAISETVSAAKALKKLWAKNLINALLRSFQRSQSEYLQQANALPPCRWNMPDWLLDQLQRHWPEEWETISTQSQILPPLCLRINHQKISQLEAQSRLRAEGVENATCTYSSAGLTLQSASDITSLSGFREGWLSVQDEAAQLAAGLLDLAPEQRVLDACAAPGGKTAAILESEHSLTQLIAIELDESRIPRIHENLERLKLNAEVIHANAADLDAWWNGQFFDRILLDAPCSATGVIRRHPDIKLMRRESDLNELVATQMLLMKRLWQTLKPGGIMLYATCSILKTENEEQVAAFVEAHKDAKELPIQADWGSPRPFGRQLFPQEGGHDGFYYAKLIKESLG